MNLKEALFADTSVYAEYDEDSGLHCVFGDNSGFAYEAFIDKDSADKEAKRRNNRNKFDVV